MPVFVNKLLFCFLAFAFYLSLSHSAPAVQLQIVVSGLVLNTFFLREREREREKGMITPFVFCVVAFYKFDQKFVKTEKGLI
jgi:hypothetical protein